MKDKSLYIAEAFMVAGTFIGIKFFECDSDEIDILQSKFFVVISDDKDWRLNPVTWDDSAWNDWIQATKKVLDTEIINLKEVRVSLIQAYLIMKQFIKDFAYEYDFSDLIQLYNEIHKDQESGFKESKQWKQWIFSVKAVLNCMITNQGFLYKSDNAIFTQEQAYEIMQKFLINFCLKIKHMKEVDLLLKNDFLKQWETVYARFSNEKVTLYQAYNIMVQFLYEWAQQYLDNKESSIFVEQFEVGEDESPIDYSFFYHWVREANKVLIDI